MTGINVKSIEKWPCVQHTLRQMDNRRQHGNILEAGKL